MPLPPFLRRSKPAPASAPEATPETARSQARRRLIGAVVLLGLGVIAFPLLFETEPRPIPVDLPIVIPPRETAPPLAMPPPAGASGATVLTAPSPAPPEPAAEPASEPRPSAALEPQPEPLAPSPKAAVPSDVKPAPAKQAPANDGARARALLEGKAPTPTAASPVKAVGRYAVQIGAFAEDKTVREVRAKARQAGLETTTQVITVKTGEITRIRVGPFTTREAADVAAAKARDAGLPASVLKL